MESLLLPAFASTSTIPPSPGHFAPRSASMISPPSPMQIAFSRSSMRRHIEVPCAAPAAASPSEDLSEVEHESESKKDHDALSPNSFEVQSLLMEICDETSIAELELKMNSFKLRVKRDASKLKSSADVIPVAPPVPSKPMEDSGVPVVVPSPATNSNIKWGSNFGLLEAAADEGIHFVTSPKVGFFRRSRLVKGKFGRPLCEETQNVKEGQVLCYLDQLGIQVPVEAETAGEVIKILCRDGEAVGYGDPLIAIRPSFAGIR